MTESAWADPRMHGDPRHHVDDIAELKAENERLKAEVQRLRYFTGRVADYSNDSWLAREALAIWSEERTAG